MSDTKVCPCVSCGIPSEVHKKAALDRVFCSSCKAKKNKENSKKYRTWYTITCEYCGAEKKSTRKNQRFCSRSCASLSRAQELKETLVPKPCLDCGVLVKVPKKLQSRYVRCPTHKAIYKEKMAARHVASQRGYRRIENGEAPYEDYVVRGPVWSSRQSSYGWRVEVRHKSNSNRRDMSLAHYNLSVKLGRRVQDREELVFLDGDIDNCDPSNLELKENLKKSDVA